MIEVRGAGMTPKMQERVDKSATASLFGQFRSSVADFLWLKVDKYMHNGVELRGLTEMEEKKANTELAKTDEKDVAGGFAQHVEETTVVPSAKNDWRGVLGDVERAVQPYQDMSNHTHRDPKEALPLYRLMTTANPNFIPGYVYGAAMISRDKTKYAEAMAFLREGESNNPNSIEIKTEIGMMYVGKLREFEKGGSFINTGRRHRRSVAIRRVSPRMRRRRGRMRFGGWYYRTGTKANAKKRMKSPSPD
jgi:hypothetical protein